MKESRQAQTKTRQDLRCRETDNRQRQKRDVKCGRKRSRGTANDRGRWKETQIDRDKNRDRSRWKQRRRDGAREMNAERSRDKKEC